MLFSFRATTSSYQSDVVESDEEEEGEEVDEPALPSTPTCSPVPPSNSKVVATPKWRRKIAAEKVDVI